jgi:hypothetical protein
LYLKMTGQRELMRSPRLSETLKKRFIVAVTAGALTQGVPTDPSPPARVSKLIDAIGGEQYLSRA